MKYLIVVHKDPKSDYGVIVPDLPGCFASGDDFQDVKEEIVSAIRAHINLLVADGESIPKPLSMADHQENPKYAGAYAWANVEVPESRWQKWVCKELMPLETPILVELAKKEEKQYQVARFFKNNQDQIIGIVGNAFLFEVTIIRWKILTDFIGAE